MLEVIELVCELIRIPSVNPMGRNVSGAQFFETALTDHLQQRFETLGLLWQRQQVEPQRENIIARLDGSVPVDAGGQLIMFEAHQDTVPVDAMSIPPFTPQIRDERVYGRGACDVKGALSCMLAALARLAEERPSNMPTIVMACTVDEEQGLSGASRLTDFWTVQKSPILPRPPDAVVVAEPTGLNVVVAHKGVLRWKCHTAGRSCHSSTPERGENAIYKMGPVVSALAQYSGNVLAGLGRHRILGSPTLNIGLISGGVSVNTVPDRCTIEIDRRLLPNEDSEKAYRHAVAYLAAQETIDEPPTHDPPYLVTPGLSDESNRDVADQLCQIARGCGTATKQIGVSFGTNAPAYAGAGAPSVVFGPGHIEQAHTADEWVEIDQLKRATEILYQFGRTGLV